MRSCKRALRVGGILWTQATHLVSALVGPFAGPVVGHGEAAYAPEDHRSRDDPENDACTGDLTQTVHSHLSKNMPAHHDVAICTAWSWHCRLHRPPSRRYSERAWVVLTASECSLLECYRAHTYNLPLAEETLFPYGYGWWRRTAGLQA